MLSLYILTHLKVLLTTQRVDTLTLENASLAMHDVADHALCCPPSVPLLLLLCLTRLLLPLYLSKSTSYSYLEIVISALSSLLFSVVLSHEIGSFCVCSSLIPLFILCLVL